jgi:4-amino-4-deoxy-L-arabinose transferase-like glycosyltransferase
VSKVRSVPRTSNHEPRTTSPAARDLGILLLLGLLVLGAGLGMRDPWPADEPRFALVGREMVESGQWLIPHRAGEPYPDKPPVFFWMIGAAYLLTGSLRLAFLLPSLLAGLVSLALVHDIARRLWHRRVAMAAGLALLATVQFTLQARTAQIDAVLAMWTTLAVYGLLRHLLLGPAWGWWYAAFAAMGLGVITKGVGFLPLLLLLPWALARRQAWPGVPRFAFPWRHAVLGPLLMAATAAAWAVPMMLSVAASGDPVMAAYRDNLLFKQTGQRYVAAWHHIRWLGYYAVGVVPWAWLPISVALPWLVPAWWRRARRREARTLLLVGWAALVLLFFSVSPGKRGVYILPAVPAIALAAAPLLPGLVRRRAVQRTALAAAATLAALLLGVAAWLLAAPPARLAPLLERNDVPPSVVWPVLVLGVLGAATVALLRRRGVVALLLVMAATWLVTGWWIQPLLNSTRSAAPMMAAVGEAIGADGELALVQWKEQFVLFADRPVKHFGYFRADTEREAREAVAWALAAPHRWVLLPRESAAPCFLEARCVDVGQRNRREWLLAPAAAIDPACAGATR